MKKRILSLALALVMAAGLFPVTALAYDMGKPGQYQTISAGGSHSLAIHADGSLWSWGDDGSGELGDGITEERRSVERHSPVKVMDNVAAVSAGFNHSLVLQTDGSLWTWGYNWYGQLGIGDWDDIVHPDPVKVMDNVAAVSAGNNYSLAIQADGSLWAWGENESGQLGDGTTEDRHSPVKIMDNVAAVSAGENHSLAIKTDGSLWAWGENEYGQLGDGTTTSRSTPVKVMDNVKLPAAPIAQPSTQTVNVDGKSVEFAMYALGGGSVNYIRVRDLAALLNGTAAQFEVGWDGKVVLTAKSPYTGSTDKAPFSTEMPYTTYAKPTYVNGAPVTLDAIQIEYNGGGYTYYKLRDLAEALGFNVGWSSDKGVYVETNKPYDPNN